MTAPAKMRELVVTAAHEAGHVVIGSRCGFVFVSVAMRVTEHRASDDPNYQGMILHNQRVTYSGSGEAETASSRISNEQIDGHILTALAGPAAEAYTIHRMDGGSLVVAQKEVYAGLGASHDMKNVERFIARSSFNMQSAKTLVHSMIEQWWDAIGNMTQELRRRQRLSARQIRNAQKH